MEFNEARMLHSLAVARKMKKEVEKSPQKFSASPEDMFYLGLIHDAAYEFVDSQEEHEHRGGEILKLNGYKYWKEVYYHGNPDSEFDSAELRLLNYADMTTALDGKDVTIDGRLADIAVRYGKTSSQYKNAESLAQKIDKQRQEKF